MGSREFEIKQGTIYNIGAETVGSLLPSLHEVIESIAGKAAMTAPIKDLRITASWTYADKPSMHVLPVGSYTLEIRSHKETAAAFERLVFISASSV